MTRCKVVFHEDGIHKKIVSEEKTTRCKMCGREIDLGETVYVCEIDRRAICQDCARSKEFHCSRLPLPRITECTEYCGVLTNDATN